MVQPVRVFGVVDIHTLAQAWSEPFTKRFQVTHSIYDRGLPTRSTGLDDACDLSVPPLAFLHALVPHAEPMHLFLDIDAHKLTTTTTSELDEAFRSTHLPDLRAVLTDAFLRVFQLTPEIGFHASMHARQKPSYRALLNVTGNPFATAEQAHAFYANEIVPNLAQVLKEPGVLDFSASKLYSMRMLACSKFATNVEEARVLEPQPLACSTDGAKQAYETDAIRYCAIAAQACLWTEDAGVLRYQRGVKRSSAYANHLPPSTSLSSLHERSAQDQVIAQHTRLASRVLRETGLCAMDLTFRAKTIPGDLILLQPSTPFCAFRDCQVCAPPRLHAPSGCTLHVQPTKEPQVESHESTNKISFVISQNGLYAHCYSCCDNHTSWWKACRLVLEFPYAYYEEKEEASEEVDER